MYQIIRSDGYYLSLNVRNLPVIVNDKYEIVTGPNMYIYRKIANGDWNSYRTWDQRASELCHYLNWLGCCKDKVVERPDWDLATSEIITKYWRSQQDICIRENRHVPVDAINARLSTVYRFYKWCAEEHIFNLVDVNDISRKVYVRSDPDDNALAHCRSLSSFYVYTNKLKLRKVKKSMVRFIVTRDDFSEACSYFNDIAFLICAYLYYLCGLRRFEITQFLTLDSDQNPDLLSKKKLERTGKINQKYLKYKFIGKGNISREIEIPTILWVLILDHYLPQRILREEKFRQKMELDSKAAKLNGGVTTDLLLLTKTGAKLTPENISRAFSAVQRSCGFPFRPHMLRHTFATEFIWRYEQDHPNSEGRFDVVVHDELRIMMGHTRPSTTKKYIHLVEMLKSSKLIEDYRPSLDERMDHEFGAFA